jgi:hypothetical protein
VSIDRAKQAMKKQIKAEYRGAKRIKLFHCNTKSALLKEVFCQADWTQAGSSYIGSGTASRFPHEPMTVDVSGEMVPPPVK